ncbi:MAG: AAA family ATPase [Pseudomonadota bacterium]
MDDQQQDASAFLDFAAPAWFSELATGLSIRSQFILTGNVRDVYPLNRGTEIEFAPFESAVWNVLEASGCTLLLIHDPVDGLRIHDECDQRFKEVLDDLGFELGRVVSTPREIAALATKVATEARVPMALMFDYGSMMLRQAGDELDKLYVALDKLSRAPALARPDQDWQCPPRNPVMWVLDRVGDMPEWLTTRNPGLRDMSIGNPDLSDRISFMTFLASGLSDYDGLSFDKQSKFVEQFAVGCEGMMLMDMLSIVDLARAEQIGLADLAEAQRHYILGTNRNPWTSPVMRQRVTDSKEVLERRVKGQPRAIERTYDILVRSIMGLSGAQTTNRGSRPRGILFFVGPSGVGKTELAKSVAEVMFGDETAMNRFDMSEFMNEEAIGRLIGPPAGAPGHENGGELVNAVRARPFGVFLFDEIEKGHPRILDMFLQILDDGRLSDSRGETGYFSEALIIFTSNVGVVGGDKSANSGQNVLPSDTDAVLEEKLTRAVADHFRYNLKRPELMNRLGQNIVPFQFINTRSSGVIFDAVVMRVLNAVREEHGVDVILTPGAKDDLEAACTFELLDGGRGIGNRIESNLINPLSRLLFTKKNLETLTITGVEAQEAAETKLIYK